MKFTSSLLSLLIPSLISAFPLASLFKRVTDLNATTQNDLTNGTPCLPLTIVYARGTNSPGNVGDQPGPQLFQAIANLIDVSNLAVQGVDYPGNIFGYLEGGDQDGSDKLASLAAQAVSQCPDTKLVLSGYSQGGQLVHNGANQFSADTAAFVSSVVIFGDPFNGTAVGTVDPSKVLIFCHPGDDICLNGISITEEHLNYSNDVPAAAQFIVGKAGL